MSENRPDKTARLTKRQLLDIASTDALTGLLNRRAIDERLQRAWDEADPARAPLAVAMVDVDLFKSFNERFGQPAGDACLRVVAEALQDPLRAFDMVGRFGGDEFLAIFPDTEVSLAIDRAERMREAVNRASVHVEGIGSVAVSVSIGVAQVRWEVESRSAQTLESADAALYAAKRTGRNRVVAAGQRENLLRAFRGEEDLDFPAVVEPLLGRERELLAIENALTKARLVTLIGPGGIGKTHLATAGARRIEARFPGGLYFVECSEIGDPERLALAVAERLGVRSPDERAALRCLRLLLQSQNVLLVLDNCDRLIERVAALADTLLRDCPYLRILATSREALNSSGEATIVVPPLSETASLELFAARARRSDPDFHLDAGTARTVAEICRRLDGLPLALELAATRSRMLSLNEILSGLNDRFALLGGGTRTVLPRHQTLRALFDWSYRLLSERERGFFCSLATFSEGWSFAAAEHVCAVASRAEGLDLTAQLMDKSLVLADRHEGTSRYRLLETTREYALDRLERDGGRNAACARHAAYFARLAAEIPDAWSTMPTNEWLPRYAFDLANFRAALRWSIDERGDLPLAARLARDLVPLWLEIGQPHEGARPLVWLLTGGHVSPDVAAEVNIGCAWLLRDAGRPRDALRFAERGLALAREADESLTVAFGLLVCARSLADCQERPLDAATYLEEALSLFERADHAYGRAEALNARGAARYFADDFEKSASDFGASLAEFRLIGSKYGIGRALNNLGVLSHRRGEIEQAAWYLHESVLQQERLPNRTMLGFSLMNLGEVELARENESAARHVLARARNVLSLVGNDWALANTLTHTARLAVSMEHPEVAAELVGYADAIFDRLNSPRQPMQMPLYRRLVDELRARLGLEEYDRRVSRGRALSPDHATALADTV